MNILIDADGCPVVDITLRLAKEYNLNVILFCDASHIFSKEKAEVVTVGKGADSADFALINRISAGDIVISQDYGLAALALSRHGRPITQNGKIITDNNIDTLLLTRYAAKKARSGGYRLKGPSKRTKQQDDDFERNLRKLIENENFNCTGQL